MVGDEIVVGKDVEVCTAVGLHAERQVRGGLAEHGGVEGEGRRQDGVVADQSQAHLKTGGPQAMRDRVGIG